MFYQWDLCFLVVAKFMIFERIGERLQGEGTCGGVKLVKKGRASHDALPFD